MLWCVNSVYEGLLYVCVCVPTHVGIQLHVPACCNMSDMHNITYVYIFTCTYVYNISVQCMYSHALHAYSPVTYVPIYICTANSR